MVNLFSIFLIRTFGTMCHCTVWLGNSVEVMEFPGGYCRERRTLLLYS